MLFSASFLLSLLVVASARPSIRMVHHESRAAAPRHYTKMAAAHSSQEIKLRIALAQNNMPGLIDALYDVSTPSSPSYGKHLSKEEAEQYVTPSAETLKMVNEWLDSHGITAKADTPAGDWLSFKVPVEKASQMFGADFHVFKHATGREVIRTLSYSIPAHLQGHVELMYPGISFPSGHTEKIIRGDATRVQAQVTTPLGDTKNGIPKSCNTSVTPACLQAQYQIPTTKVTKSKSKIAVSGYNDEYANEADLQTFLTQYRPDMSPNTTFTLQTLDGGDNDQWIQYAGLEADLDIQYTVGLANTIPTSFISVGETNQDDLDGFLDTVNFMLAQSSPAQVLTTSYGPNENDISWALTNKICNAYAQIGARGTSILYASGDGGVAGTQWSSCTDFVVSFPSGCPYVTVVGGTTGFWPETGAELSAGGFSNYFPTASFQKTQVAAYLKTMGKKQYAGLYNTSGRAYPDVAAQAQNIATYNTGFFTPVDGTSCSSPIFASIVGLLNDLLLKAGKSPLGWMNPFIYANPQAFNDITTGSNPGCSTNGFSAAKGWDPVTGMGSPNFPALKKALKL